MTNVIQIGGDTKLDIDPDMMLQNTIGQLKEVIVIGWDHNDELHVASSSTNRPKILWLIELAKSTVIG